MIRHNLILLYRNITRFRTTFFINLMGLSSGLACALLICLWVQDELRVDTFYTTDARLYQLLNTRTSPGLVSTGEGTSGALAESLAHEFPEIEYTSVMTPPSWFQKFTLTAGENAVNARGNFCGQDHFNVFSYGLVQGDADNVLADKNSIVISESTARRLFNTDKVIGKTVMWAWTGFKRECIVTGVYQDAPSSATYRFDFIVSFDVWNDILHEATGVDQNTLPVSLDGPFRIFMVLKSGNHADALNGKLADFAKRTFPNQNATVFITPFSERYLHGEYENGKQSGGRIEYVRLFSITAGLVLLVACINFMNLSTAKASRRIKEVGIKKTVGAPRRTLVLQFMGESLLLSVLALGVAVLITDLLLPSFNNITGKDLVLTFSTEVVLAFTAITIVTGLVAGSYPALYLSAFRPAAIVKGRIIGTTGEVWARKGLVVFQFTLTLVFIVCVLVVHKQTELMSRKDPGFEKDNVIYFEMEGQVTQSRDAFLAGLKTIPGIINASTIQQKIVVPGLFEFTDVRWEGKAPDAQVRFVQMPVHYGLIETLGMTMATGEAFAADNSTHRSAVVLNETAVREMGIRDPVGKEIQLWGMPVKIIGVSKDFHFQSMHERVKPFIFRLAPEETMTVMARIRRGAIKETLERLDAFYRTFNPGFVLECRFLDEDFQAQYRSEKRAGTLSKYFAGLAMLVSALGLLGLAAFTAERRRKEIGIRKVLGASSATIAGLLSRDLTALIAVAIIMAFPLSSLIARQWLVGFAYRITLQWWYFAGAGAILFAVAVMTIAFQTIKAATANPAAALKEE